MKAFLKEELGGGGGGKKNHPYEEKLGHLKTHRKRKEGKTNEVLTRGGG